MSGTPARSRSPIDALQTAGVTDVGQVRMVNQDAFGEFGGPAEGRHLLIVADGMGGHRGGEVASQLTIETVKRCFEKDSKGDVPFVRSSLEAANTVVYEKSRADAELAGMGTTAVSLLFDGTSQAQIAHVGDSRAYRLRGSEFTQVTDDHSVVGELVRRGQLTAEEARVHPQSNEILRAIGTQPEVQVDVQSVEVMAGDRYLLCSDGLSGMVTDDEIAEVLAAEAPADAARILIERANLAGGTDNITVLIAVLGAFGSTAEAPAASSPGGVPSAARSAAVAAAASRSESTSGTAPASQPSETGALPWLIGAAAVALIAAWWLSS